MDMRTDLVANQEKIHAGARLAQLQASVVVTTVVFSFDGAKLRLLACKVGDELDVYRLPSMSFDFSEDLLDCAREVIRTRLPLDLSQMYQVGAFENIRPQLPDASRQIEICYFTIASPGDLEFVATGSLTQLRFIEVYDQAELLESHSREIAQAAVNELRRRTRFETVAFSFLAHEFSLSELQRVFEGILNRPMDVRNFRKKIESLDILAESPHRPRGMAYRPPRMFTFESERFRNRQTLDGEVRFY